MRVVFIKCLCNSVVLKPKIVNSFVLYIDPDIILKNIRVFLPNLVVKTKLSHNIKYPKSGNCVGSCVCTLHNPVIHTRSNQIMNPNYTPGLWSHLHTHGMQIIVHII